MGVKNLIIKALSKLGLTGKNLIKNIYPGGLINKSDDLAYIKLPGLDVLLKREIVSNQPHEVHVIIPRAEIRKKCFPDGKVEYELIYNGVTIVSASRHPRAGPQEQKPHDSNDNGKKNKRVK